MHIDMQKFRVATSDSATYFGSDKVNYMPRIVRILKECQDARAAADEACSLGTDDELAHERFRTCWLQQKQIT